MSIPCFNNHSPSNGSGMEKKRGDVILPDELSSVRYHIIHALREIRGERAGAYRDCHKKQDACQVNGEGDLYLRRFRSFWDFGGVACSHGLFLVCGFSADPMLDPDVI